MADEVDVATSLIDGELERALRKIREENVFQGEGAKVCIECGEEMPEARKKLGFKFCVSCAEERERRKSLFVD